MDLPAPPTEAGEVARSAIWPSGPETLWTARLFPTYGTADPALATWLLAAVPSCFAEGERLGTCRAPTEGVTSARPLRVQTIGSR